MNFAFTSDYFDIFCFNKTCWCDFWGVRFESSTTELVHLNKVFFKH